MRKRYVAAAVLLGVFLVMTFSMLSTRISQAPLALRNESQADEGITPKDKRSFKKGGKKADSPDLFAAYQRLIRTRDGETGPTYPENYRINELLKARGVSSTQALSKMNSTQALNWIERGPGNVAGRTRSIIVDPSDPTNNTWYVGSIGGGVWKTTNAGQTWKELTAGLTSLTTGNLAMSPANPNVIYAGTGEGYIYDYLGGTGIWKSTDRGQTWQQLGSTANNNFQYITRMIIDPQNENLLLASTTTGIYRTTNGGLNWTQVYNSGGISVDQIIVNPRNFKTQYATVNSTGILKSVDGGITWSPSSTGVNGVARMELAIAPTDTSRLYISAQAGTNARVYISEDGGASWALGKPVETTTLDFLGGQGWYDNTIAVHPYDKETVFAGGVSIFKFETRTGSATERTVLSQEYLNTQSFLAFVASSGQLAGGGISFGSVSAANQPSIEVRFGPGKKQKAHRFLVPAGATSGVPAASYSYQDYVDVPFEVWDIDGNRQLMVSFRDQTRNGVFELGPSDLTLAREYIFPQLETYNATTPSTNITKAGGHTFNQLYLIWPILAAGGTWNPDNLPNSLIRIRWGLLTSRNVSRSVFIDGYQLFGGSHKNVHVDHHNIVLLPTNPAQQQFRFINANDGGVSYSDDNGTTFIQTGDTWRQRNRTTEATLKGYNTTQFYGADKMNGADRYIGGMQDNGSWFSPENADATSAWTYAPSGDGFEAVWHYRDSQKMLESSQGNNFFRSLDGGANWHNVSPPETGATPFISKFAKSKQDPDLIFATSQSGIWRSDDFTSRWTLTTMPTGFAGSPSNAQVKISLASPQVVWAGDGMRTSRPLYVSTDGGITFNPTQIFSTSFQGSISGLATHPKDERTAYALFSFANRPKVLRTTDLGQTWTELSGFGSGSSSTNGFPNVTVFCLLVMPYDPNLIWVGTEIGIFESKNGGVTWAYADNGLPPVIVYDLSIVNDEVIAATHGRGIWSVALPELAGYEPQAAVLSPRFRELSGGFNGIINAKIGLLSAYDSSFVTIDGAKFQRLGANAAAKDTSLNVTVPTTAPRTVQVAMLSYRGGKTYRSPASAVDLLVIKAPQLTYSTNFNVADDVSANFALDGLEVEPTTGFANTHLGSKHPYAADGNFTAVLLRPIIVGSTKATLQYRDVAIVEPGEDGSVFGDDDFYDYVVVEATADLGKTWKPIAPGYDARDDAAWLAAYTATPPLPGTSAMFKARTINLLSTFKAGDQIIIRFRLYSDANTVGWGWALDDLIIDNTTSVAEEASKLPTTFELSQNYPNPFNPSTKIKYALPKNADVKIVVYNAYGQRVRTLVDQAKQNAGYHEIVWNGTNDAGHPVATGVYFYKLTTKDYVRTLKMMFVK